jgi:hypothetical protein
MGTCGFSVLGRPAVRRRRIAAPAAWLAVLALGLALAGCAALAAAARAGSALQAAGYQNANVNVSSGSGLPAGGLVSVSYSGGPAGHDQADARHAEEIVWDTYSDRFGAVAVMKVSGGCTGPFCMTRSDEVASATYAQLAARFGPRPPGLGTGSTALPGWAVPVGLGVAVGGIVLIAAIVLAVILRRKRSRPPGPPGAPGAPGPPAGWPFESPSRVP